MITVNQAVSIIKSSVVQLKTEYINVENAINRILATDIKSKADSPPFDRSSMDGYAIKINKNFNQTKFKVINEIFAGMIIFSFEWPTCYGKSDFILLIPVYASCWYIFTRFSA